MKSNVKSVLSCLLDTDGIIRKEFVPPGQNADAKYYCDVVMQLRDDTRQKQPDKRRANCVLHQQCARAHRNVTVPPPTYSPDLVPCYFFLFSKMKILLKGRRFDTIEKT